MSIEESLRSLKDVRGVFGSFVTAGSGVVVARDLPEVFSDEVFAQVGPRLARLSETLSVNGSTLDQCVIRYDSHKLHLRRIDWGLLGIISTHDVNTAALRMVTNLVARRIDPQVSASVSPVPPRASAVPRAVPASATPAPPASVRSVAPAIAPALAASAAVTAAAETQRTPVVAQDGRGGPASPNSERRVRMYRGRLIEE
ncbi:MAG TPA: hypothetical protein VHM70_18130 [Polyangiaceae bacterium]|jgi:predicted regulator of Ras-like GTPase activity (Roadblock/LC7/MglB family)|nr:hypothetical protein [Polyangiaceae bacterium]